VADYHDLVFFKDTNSLYVNIFTPASVTWDHSKTRVTLRQETRFPESEETIMRLSLSRADKFALKLRQPGWLAGSIEVKVNNQSVDPIYDAKHWVVIQRKWHDGDRVSVRLPMHLKAERFPAASTAAFPAAIVYGPVVLACRSPEGNPVSRINFSDLEATLQSCPGEPLAFHLASDSNVLFRPYYQFKEGERYFIYFDPKHPWTRLPLRDLKFSPGWSLNLTEDMQITTNVGACVEHTFTGNAVCWLGRKFDDAGICEVSIDGKAVAKVDQYDPVRDTPFRYELQDLPPGQHTIRLSLLAEKNSASKNRFANITAFDVVCPLTPTTDP
jgi:hypothetical protein